jgi:hypothetical protein
VAIHSRDLTGVLMPSEERPQHLLLQ